MIMLFGKRQKYHSVAFSRTKSTNKEGVGSGVLPAPHLLLFLQKTLLFPHRVVVVIAVVLVELFALDVTTSETVAGS